MKTGLYSKNGKKDAKYVWEKKAGTAYLLRAGGAAGIFGLSCLLLGGCGRQRGRNRDYICGNRIYNKRPGSGGGRDSSHNHTGRELPRQRRCLRRQDCD